MSIKKPTIKDMTPKVSILPPPRIVDEDDDDDETPKMDDSEHDSNSEVEDMDDEDEDDLNSGESANNKQTSDNLPQLKMTLNNDGVLPILPSMPRRKPRTKKVYPSNEKMFDELIKAMCEQREATRKVITLAKETQKCVNHELKAFRSAAKKTKTDKPKRKPRGFALPSPISKEMVDYLINEAKITHIDRKVEDQVIGQIKIEYGCSLARNELTSALCRHFENHNMRKNEQDKRKIYLDKVTTKLFNIDKKQHSEAGGLLSAEGEIIITYFDLQKYLPSHCGKKATGH